jgi:hypothetical protein
MATRVSSSGGSTSTVRPQTNRDCSRSSRPSISQLLRKELNVVDEQGIHRTVVLHEVLHGALLERFDHVLNEALRVKIDHLGIGIFIQHTVADRLHEMRLAQAHPAIEQQRVVRLAGVGRNLQGGGLGQLV